MNKFNTVIVSAGAAFLGVILMFVVAGGISDRQSIRYARYLHNETALIDTSVSKAAYYHILAPEQVGKGLIGWQYNKVW